MIRLYLEIDSVLIREADDPIFTFLRPKYKDWCVENIGYGPKLEWDLSPKYPWTLYYLLFENIEDSVLFKLTHGI